MRISTRVETARADQNRRVNVNKSKATLAPIVGQCYLPTHTWRKSNCNVNLNSATFNCQVRNFKQLAFRRRTPRDLRYKWKSLQTSLYSVLNAMLSLFSGFF